MSVKLGLGELRAGWRAGKGALLDTRSSAIPFDTGNWEEPQSSPPVLWNSAASRASLAQPSLILPSGVLLWRHLGDSGTVEWCPPALC